MPLASGDPIPGDPDVVELAGRDYRLIAHAIETAASRLRTIASDISMQSDAVAEIRGRAHELAEQVERAHDRYEAIGSALIGYAVALSEAQVSSLKALRMAQEAQATWDGAQWLINAAQPRIALRALDPDAHASLVSAQRRQETATAEIAIAQTILDRAVQHRDEAAEAARRVIDAAKSHDGLNDSRWDNIKAATISALESVAKVVDMIAIGAGVLALVFAAVPFVGEFFAAVALIASILSLALKLTLKAFGEGSWKEIGIAALGVAAFGVGKVAIGSAEGAAAGARLAANRAAVEAPGLRSAAAFSLGSADDAVMGAGNAMSQTGVRAAAGEIADLGVGAALREGLGSIRALPRTVAEDLTNIGQFDVLHPIAQFRNLTPVSPLSFLGERAAAAESLGLNRLPDAALDASQVVRQINIRDISLGAFVTTWATGTALLGRDTANLVHGDLDAVGSLLAGAKP